MDETKKIRVTMTDKDLRKCGCGNDLFLASIRVATTKSPIIGQPPLVALGAGPYLCAKCGVPLRLEGDKPKILAP